MRDLYHDFLPEVSFYPLLKTAIADGDAYVDLQGYEGALIIITAGAIADGSGVVTLYTWELKESDDHVTFTAVAAADLLGSEPSFEAVTGATHEENVSKSFGYIGTKRYLRVDLVAVPSTAGAGGTFSGEVVKGRPRHAPAV